MITFDPIKHKYFDHSGIEYISVTTLIGRKFPFDSHEIATKVSQIKSSKYYGKDIEDIKNEWKASAEIGHDIHEAIENYINEKVLPTDKKTLRCVEQFGKLKFKGELKSEMLIWHSDYKIAGTMDLLELGDINWIFDLKTSKKMDEDRLLKYSIQLELYKKLIKHSHNIDAQIGGIIWFDPRENNKLKIFKTYKVNDYVNEILDNRKNELIMSI